MSKEDDNCTIKRVDFIIRKENKKGGYDFFRWIKYIIIIYFIISIYCLYLLFLPFSSSSYSWMQIISH